MTRFTTLVTAAVFAMAAATALQAQCDGCDSGCASCAAPACCSAPNCQAAGRCCGGPACIGKAEMVDVENQCWNIECEDICVPAVRFPWEHGGSKLTFFSLFNGQRDRCNNPGCTDSCDGNGADGCASCVAPKCGFVVTVRSLKKKTYDAKACKYSIAPADGSHVHCDQCASPVCAGCAAAPAYEVMQQEDAPAASQPIPAAAPQPLPAAPRPTAKGSKLGKLKFVSLKSRLFGDASSK